MVPVSSSKFAIIVLVIYLVSIEFGVTKEYKFCSKDKVLYTFTSEACPGGIFLKEPLIMDPQCYCHDTEYGNSYSLN